jgi:CcmD family protein
MTEKTPAIGTRHTGARSRPALPRKLLWRFATVAVILLGLMTWTTAAPATILAQQPPAAQEGFVPVTDVAPDDQLPAAPLVIAAYAVAWIAVVLYLWSIWRRLSRVEREMAAVSRRLESGARR